MKTLEEPPLQAPVFAVIDNLDPEPIIVKTPIPVEINMVDDDFVASFVEANIGATGNSLDEALFNLKDIIATIFARIENIPENKLGKALQRQQRVLRAALVRRD